MAFTFWLYALAITQESFILYDEFTQDTHIHTICPRIHIEHDTHIYNMLLHKTFTFTQDTFIDDASQIYTSHMHKTQIHMT